MNVTLVGFTKKGSRKDIPVQGAATIIGRIPEADIQIPVSDVSRRHCEITVKGSSVFVKDLKSSNGTFVNDEKVTDKVLKPGDRLRVGPFTFVVQIDGNPKDIRAASVSGAAAPAKKSASPPKAVAKAPASDQSASDFDLDDLDVDALENVDLDDMSPIGDLDELEEISPDELEELDSSDILDEDEGPSKDDK